MLAAQANCSTLIQFGIPTQGMVSSPTAAWGFLSHEHNQDNFPQACPQGSRPSSTETLPRWLWTVSSWTWRLNYPGGLILGHRCFIAKHKRWMYNVMNVLSTMGSLTWNACYVYIWNIFQSLMCSSVQKSMDLRALSSLMNLSIDRFPAEWTVGKRSKLRR